MDKMNNQQGMHAFRRLGIIGFVTLAVGCATTSDKVVADADEADADSVGEVIKVAFDSSGCPKYVDKQEVGLGQTSGKKLKWQAYNLELSSEKSDAYYTVIFDPFVGKSISAGKNDDGEAKSQALKNYTPTGVFFKYTILGEDKDGNELTSCDPLDPYFRIL